MMLDADVVAVSPSSVYRVLREAGVMDRFNGKPSKKGTGFQQPAKPHEHWHVDISYLNICGTFYFMGSILDGCSRSIIHWEIRERMQEIDVEVILQRAREKFPDARPRIITDSGVGTSRRCRPTMVVLPNSETNHASNAAKKIHAGLPEGHETPAANNNQAFPPECCLNTFILNGTPQIGNVRLDDRSRMPAQEKDKQRPGS